MPEVRAEGNCIDIRRVPPYTCGGVKQLVAQESLVAAQRSSAWVPVAYRAPWPRVDAYLNAELNGSD